MAVPDRILPQWLHDLRTGDSRLDKIANGVKNNRKTPRKNGTVPYKRETSDDEKGKRKISRIVAETDGTDRSEKNAAQKENKVSPGQREKNSRTTVRVPLVMSSSDEEDDNKPSLICSKVEDNGMEDMDVCVKLEPPGVSAETNIIRDNNVHKESDTDAEKADIDNTPQVSTSNEDQGEIADKADEQVSNSVNRADDGLVSNGVISADGQVSNGVNSADDGQVSSSVNTADDGSNKINRLMCKYGQSCYRKNPQHCQDFSHPGDDDYNTVDNRPECEYGLSCYRKNYLHRQHYKHTKKVQKPRKAKRQKKQDALDNDDDEEDDYDLDDPFIDDASSDDYRPSDNDSETDISAVEEVSDNEDDANQTSNSSKKLQKKRKR